MSRQLILDRLNQFKDGKSQVLDIPNPMFVSGCNDLWDFPVRPNFTLREFAVSIVKRPGLRKNQAPSILVHKELADHLQSLRNRLRQAHPNATISIVSGYRSPGVDRLVGGSGGGPHTRGWAADVKFNGISVVGRSVDSIRRGAAYEAFRLGCKGIELILGGTNVHLDPVRSNQWIVRQAMSNGRFAYPNISLSELSSRKLPGF